MTLPTSSSSGAVISLANVSRRFGEHQALDDVSLHVPRGGVFGLVGANGAGKTTLIRHILGLLEPDSGTVRVFDLDPAAESVEVLRRIGYLSETRDLPGSMTVGELLRYTRAFHPGWDPAFAESLREQFGLNPDARVKHLSQGQLAKAGLIVALAYRPELLLLDEPSSGLDPVVRRDILEAIIRTVADEGRTVLFSSHLLDEIERVADHVAMIHGGRIALSGRLEDVKAAHRRVTIQFPSAPPRAPRWAGWWEVQGHGREWSGLVNGPRERWIAEAVEAGAVVVDDRPVTLDEILVARVAGHENSGPGAAARG